jgi:hypothetical protein
MVKIANFDAVRESNSVSQPIESVGEDHLAFGADGYAVKFDRRPHGVAHAQIELTRVRICQGVRFPALCR